MPRVGDFREKNRWISDLEVLPDQAVADLADRVVLLREEEEDRLMDVGHLRRRQERVLERRRDREAGFDPRVLREDRTGRRRAEAVTEDAELVGVETTAER